MTYRLTSNITELGEFEGRNEAIAEAVAESERYDDIVRIEHDGRTVYFAQYGVLYTATIAVTRKSARRDATAYPE